MVPLFPTWLYVSNSGPAHLNQRLERLAHRLMRDPEQSIVRSNYGGWHYRHDLFELDRDVIREFRAAMEHHVRAFLAHFRRPGEPAAGPFALKGWLNVNREGDYNVLHSHPGSFLSAAYYVKVPQRIRGGEICFRDPRGPAVAMYETPKIGLPWVGSGMGLPFEPIPGRLLLFPSWLEHRVERFTGRGERISISFNASNA